MQYRFDLVGSDIHDNLTRQRRDGHRRGAATGAPTHRVHDAVVGTHTQLDAIATDRVLRETRRDMLAIEFAHSGAAFEHRA